MLIHSDENPYQCTIFGKQFKDSKNHMLIHSGKKPFQCTVCDQQFTRNYHHYWSRQNHTARNERWYIFNA